MFYAKSTSGFYDSSIHGERVLVIVDPSWTRPTVREPDPNWTAPANESGATAPLIEVPDMSVVAPTVTVPNPACQIPADAVEITAEEHQALLAAQSAGDIIMADGNGKPIAVDPASLTTLPEAQEAQGIKLNSACQAAIVAGFISSALGSKHTYPAQTTDQQNLSASVLASLLPGLPAGWTTPFWCADANGNWTYAEHTAAQIQQVGQDGKAAIIAAIQKKAGLLAQVNAATTVGAVQAINWS